MPTTTLRFYQSADVGAPTLNATSGSALAVFNACLVDGYGSMAGAGWSKPLPDTSSYGLFQQPTGSGCYLFVRDDARWAGSAKDAKCAGWDTITSIMDGRVTGSNQFPAAAQLALGYLSTGSVVIRKSTTIDATPRAWMLFADSSSFYFYNQAGDVANTWNGFFFGDIYSIKTGSIDSAKCMIVGRVTENSATATGDRLDITSLVNAAVTGHFISKTFSGTGTSITAGKHSDASKCTAGTMTGLLTYPNSVDNGLYLSPMWVTETVANVIRGRMKGFWQICHPVASFADGQVITGTGEFAGKTFMVIKSPPNGGLWCMETSATVETNE